MATAYPKATRARPFQNFYLDGQRESEDRQKREPRDGRALVPTCHTQPPHLHVQEADWSPSHSLGVSRFQESGLVTSAQHCHFTGDHPSSGPGSLDQVCVSGWRGGWGELLSFLMQKELQPQKTNAEAWQSLA